MRTPMKKGTQQLVTSTTYRLNEKRRERWTDMVESIDFTHSSRRAWHTINKLTGRINTSSPCPITANSIATTIVRNGRFPNADKTFARQTNSNVHKLRRAPSVDSILSGEFSPEEMKTALKHLKSGKSPGLDNIHPEFPLNQGVKATEWLRLFCSQCLHSCIFPKIYLATLQSDCHPKAQQAPGRPKRVPADCSPMCSLQVLRAPTPYPTRPGHRPTTSLRASWLPSRQIHSRPGDSPHPGHRGRLRRRRESGCYPSRPLGCL